MAAAKKKDLSQLTAFISKGNVEQTQLRPEQRGIHAPAEETKPRKRERFTVNLAPDLIEWARRAVVFTPGQSLTRLMEDALTRELKRQEKERGEPYPATTETPHKGRPVTLKKV